jgi:hypothetical protein
MPNSCPAGQVCQLNGSQLTCVPPCTTVGAPACPSGRCAPDDPFADARGCASPICTEQPVIDCGPVSACDPSAKNRDASGCARLLCKTTADCPCGICTQGECYEHPLHCFVQLALP